jgi:hypothetical protein
LLFTPIQAALGPVDMGLYSSNLARAACESGKLAVRGLGGSLIGLVSRL